MSKELVISSSRHETKVAVLEDDQLVEIYFQRANEYSLAGSIHKGRVTRVLPGMQSAFVDIGLERDAFLYVTDFFEEHGDDVDTVSLEEKPPARERRQALAPPPVSQAPMVERPSAAVSAPSSLAEKTSEPPSTERPVERSSDRPDDGRGGRRGRRRRQRGGGRGLPESKYASDLADTSETPEAAPDFEAASSPEESGEPLPFVLPGETLAKYSRAAASSPGFEPDAPASVHDQEPATVELAADEPAHSVALDEPSFASEEASPVDVGEPEPEPFDTTASGEREPEPSADAEIVRVESVTDLESDPVLMGDAAEETDAPVAVSLSEPEPEWAADAEHAGADLEPADTGSESVDLRAEETEPAEEAESSAGLDAATAEADAAPPEEGASANVREKNERLPHRGARRMRRRRGGQDRGERTDRTPAAAPVAERAEEPTPELEPVAIAAPEPTELSRPRAERPEKERLPLPSIADLLKEGQEIIVQIAKEPINQKGARITSHIALPGRYVVYMPTVEHMGVSRKIESDEERQRLKRILQAQRTGVPGGYIVRTAGAGKSEEEIASDMQFLFNLWLDMRQKAEKRRAPMLLHHDLDIVQRILRDQLTDTFKTVTVDQEEMYESVLRFCQRFQPALVSRVKLYTRPQPIFDSFGISSELEKALRPKVWLKSGGYIVINQTEALVAIDVNTGKYVGKSNKLEDTIVKTNTDAVKEIVRQIRLRDLGGIIVVDFIDMDEKKNRQKVMQVLEEAMRADRAPYKILQFNDFGLVAITRKRVKQSLERTLCSPCPYCEGAGMVKSTQTVIGEILQEAHKIAKAVDTKDVLLRVNPEVAKVLKSNTNRFLEEIEETLKRPVMVKSDPQLHQEKFDLA